MRLIFRKPLAEAAIKSADMNLDVKSFSGEFTIVLESQIPAVLDKAREFLESDPGLPNGVTFTRASAALLTGSSGRDTLKITMPYTAPVVKNMGARNVPMSPKEKDKKAHDDMFKFYEWICKATGCQTGFDVTIDRRGKGENFAIFYIVEPDIYSTCSPVLSNLASALAIKVYQNAVNLLLPVSDVPANHPLKSNDNIVWHISHSSTTAPQADRVKIEMLDMMFERYGLAKPSEVKAIMRT